MLRVRGNIKGVGKQRLMKDGHENQTRWAGRVKKKNINPSRRVEIQRGFSKKGGGGIHRFPGGGA